MTFGELKSLVLSWLDDPQGGYFTDSNVSIWLNNAQKETQKRLLGVGENWYLKCAQTTTVVNQQLYLLPQDFLKVNRLELIIDGTAPQENKSVLAPITFNQQDYSPQQTGNPESYVLKKNALALFPVPDTAKTIRLNYSYRVANMVFDSDQPDVPEQYHEFLAVLAALDGALKDKTEMSGVLEKKRDYEAMLKSDADQRTVDQPRSIVVTEDDGFARLF